LHYTVVGRLPARHNVWDSAILVPVEDVWQVHGMAQGHDPAHDQHIGPPWDAKYLSGVPAVAVKPNSVAAYSLRGQFRNARSVALFPAEVLNDLYLTLGNVRDLLSHWAQLQLGFEMPVRLGSAEGLLVGGLVLAGALNGLLPAWLSFRRSIAEGLVSA
jgi:putative ABC transport system permease protein